MIKRKWVNYKEAGELLGVNAKCASKTIRQSINGGNPFKFRISCPNGKVRLVNIDAVEKMIEKSLVA